MDDILHEQANYYRARASEYDEWFYRVGRYDRGEDFNRRWFNEVETLRREVQALRPAENALELACGTGIWTAELAQQRHTHITALDASREMLALNRSKVGRDEIHYGQTDLFAWEPETAYDLVFFAFWLSHVPPNRLTAFLDKVSRATRSGGEVFIIDSLRDPSSTAIDHAVYQPDSIYHTRKLNNRQEFRIVKIFYEAEPLIQALSAAGFEASVATTGSYFWYARAFKR